MGKIPVVITYSVSEARRALLKKMLGDVARLSFLADLPVGLREQALIDAEVLLSWNLPKELKLGGLNLLKNVRLIQLLSAGADHVPFAGLRQNILIAANVGAYAEPMAEHVLAMALALAKNLFREQRTLPKTSSTSPGSTAC